jgi:hypothetical protein
MIQSVQVPPMPPEFFMPGPTPLEIAGAIALVVATVGSFVIVLSFVRALQRKWSSPPATDQPALEELRHAVHQLGAEVSELQERLDFAERVLASRSEPDRLDRGAG